MAKTILLVEDSRFLRVASERALVRAGYSVIAAADGEAAIELARLHRPDVILLDMMLPKLEGVSVLKTLKSEPTTAEIPVIILSGLAQKNEAKLLKQGAVAYYVKSDAMLEKDSQILVQLVEGVLARAGTGPSCEAHT